jgi:sigma-E factor negative regulatory protein RseB
MLDDLHPVRRAAQKFVLVVGAGALGAAVCSTGVRYTGIDDEDTQRALRASSAPAPAVRPVGAAEAQALALLRKAAAAESATAYTGRKYFGSWSEEGGESVLASVKHVPGRGTWVRVNTATADDDGDGAQIEEAAGELDQQALALLTDQYTLRIAEPSRCLGRSTAVVEATPIGGRTVAGRFWIDDESGLLLRRELYDGDGRTVRASEFLEVDVAPAATPTGRAQSASVQSRHATPRRSGRLLDGDALDRLRRDGWVLPEVLPAGMVLYRARSVQTGGAGEAVQLTYSDGLFAVSLFAQRGRLDTSTLEGFSSGEVDGAPVHTRSGLYQQAVWAGGDTVYTLVSDAPDPEMTQVIAALPHNAPSSALRARVGRGIDRMGSWINPFE